MEEEKITKKRNHSYNQFNSNKHLEHKPLGYPAKLVLNSIIILLIAKIYFIFVSNTSQLIIPYIISFLQDSTILILNYFLFSLIFLIGAFKKTIKILFFSIHFLIFFTSIIYTKFLSDFLNYPINILQINIDLVFFFFKNFITIENIIIIGLVIGFTLLVSKFFPNEELTQKKVKYFFIIILILFLPTLLRPAINPILYSGFEESKNFIHQSNYKGKITHINTDLNNSSLNLSKKEFIFIDKRITNNELDNIVLSNPNYQKILVFVMESQNYEDIKKENDFKITFEKAGYACEKYNNYYTTNLDSYTSLISILNSILIPYQAYASKTDYNFINNKTNLAELFLKNNYKTIFISTYNENPFIPDKNYWNEIIERKDINETNHLCLNINKIDSACEDKTAIDKIINETESNNKLFLMQEMVYGHLFRWEEKTKIKPIDYYNSFFEELLIKLNNTNLSQKTLIIITSDHGKREDATNINNYHIPLYLCANNIEKKENNQFLSHINFKDIILEKMINQKIENFDDKLFIVGSSNVWNYGLIQPNTKILNNSLNVSYIFINDKTLKVKTNMNETDVINFSNKFKDYIIYFNNTNN